MDNAKNDNYYLDRILADLSFIQKHTNNIESEELGLNEVLLDSMMFRLIQVSENSKRLSESFKEAHSNIPWKAIYGFRNRIVHDYGHVDLSVVYATIISFILIELSTLSLSRDKALTLFIRSIAVKLAFFITKTQNYTILRI